MILQRLTDINNKLLAEQDRLAQMQFNAYSTKDKNSNPNTYTDPSKNTIVNSKKKNIVECQNPSSRMSYIAPNPIPLNMPANTNNPIPRVSQYVQNNSANDTYEINIDDILNNIYDNEPDDLDHKLNKIKNLQTKILADRRRRKKN